MADPHAIAVRDRPRHDVVAYRQARCRTTTGRNCGRPTHVAFTRGRPSADGPRGRRSRTGSALSDRRPGATNVADASDSNHKVSSPTLRIQGKPCIFRRPDCFAARPENRALPRISHVPEMIVGRIDSEKWRLRAVRAALPVRTPLLQRISSGPCRRLWGLRIRMAASWKTKSRRSASPETPLAGTDPGCEH